jgi:hypothetical protein
MSALARPTVRQCPPVAKPLVQRALKFSEPFSVVSVTAGNAMAFEYRGDDTPLFCEVSIRVHWFAPLVAVLAHLAAH